MLCKVIDIYGNTPVEDTYRVIILRRVEQPLQKKCESFHILPYNLAGPSPNQNGDRHSNIEGRVFDKRVYESSLLYDAAMLNAKTAVILRWPS